MEFEQGKSVREVHKIENDGISKTLWWDSSADQAFITVNDTKNPKNNFAFEVTPDMNALQELQHACSRNPHEVGRVALYAVPEDMK